MPDFVLMGIAAFYAYLIGVGIGMVLATRRDKKIIEDSSWYLTGKATGQALSGTQ